MVGWFAGSLVDWSLPSRRPQASHMQAVVVSASKCGSQRMPYLQKVINT